MATVVAINSIIGGKDPSDGLDQTAAELIVEGTITLSANYGVAAGHGDIVDFTGQDQIKTGQVPRRVEIFEDQGAGVAPLGYSFLYAHGTDLNNGKLVVLNQATAAAKTGMVEFTQGDAYSTGTPSLNAAALRFKAWFAKFI
jgi:hypothetical protein